MDDTDWLGFLAADPADMEPAPVDPSREEAFARIGLDPKPCVVCGGSGWTTRAVLTPEHGRRWADICRFHFMALRAVHRKRLPAASMADAVEVLQAAAEETGLRMRVIASGRAD